MNHKYKQEQEVKDFILQKLQNEIADLKDEIYMGKSVLKDPKLAQLAARKYQDMVDLKNDGKFFLTDKIVTDIKDNINSKENNF